MANNKVTIDGRTIIDLSQDTVTSSDDIAEGKYAHLRTGARVLGTGQGSSSNPLSGKIIAVTGDSICRGVGNNNNGYAEIIAENNGMTVQNLSAGGATVATGTGQAGIISTSVGSLRSDADYIILEGGVNDPDFNVSLGTLTSGYTATLTTTTFAGGFEYMLKSALERFPGKKIGYVFVHKCGNFTDSWYSIAKQACEKWGIPYCDLNTQAPPLGYITALANAYTSSGDGFHPNADGYNAYYVPKITAWLKTL